MSATGNPWRQKVDRWFPGTEGPGGCRGVDNGFKGGFFRGGNENVQKADRGDGCTTHEHSKGH